MWCRAIGGIVTLFLGLLAVPLAGNPAFEELKLEVDPPN